MLLFVATAANNTSPGKENHGLPPARTTTNGIRIAEYRAQQGTPKPTAPDDHAAEPATEPATELKNTKHSSFFGFSAKKRASRNSMCAKPTSPCYTSIDTSVPLKILESEFKKFTALQEKATAGDPDAMIKIANLFMQGNNSITQNVALAQEYYKKAIEQQTANAQNGSTKTARKTELWLAKLKSTLPPELQQYPDHAKLMLEIEQQKTKVISSKDKSAMFWLANLYLRGQHPGIAPEDQKIKAVAYFKEILQPDIDVAAAGAATSTAKKSDIDTAITIESKLILVRLVAQQDPSVFEKDKLLLNPTDIRDWCRELSRCRNTLNGVRIDAEAQFYFGCFYLYGIIGTPDLHNAERYLSLAAIKGYEKAQAPLQTVREAIKKQTKSMPIVDPAELTLGEEIGKGGGGTVFKAMYTHQGDSFPVAVKVIDCKKAPQGYDLTPAESDELTKSARKESWSWHQLHYDNVAQFIGIFQQEGAFGMVMELANCDLYGYMQKNPTLSWSARISFFIDAAAGLEYIHGLNMLHLDIKARNMLLFFNKDGSITVKITDFGLARRSSIGDNTCTEAVDGTFTHMAPEIAEPFKGESPFKPAADVFSFGITLWEGCTNGADPYPKITDPFRIPSEVIAGTRPQIPGQTPSGITRLMHRCWSLNPHQRPTMTQVKQYLHEAAKSAEIQVPFNLHS